MIVPSNRLLLVTGIIISPLTLMPAYPWIGPAAGLSISVFVLLAIADIGVGLGRLEAFRVELPGVVRLARDRPGEIAVKIYRQHHRLQQLRIGLPMPPGLESPTSDLVADLDREQDDFVISWPCSGGRRGRYQLAQCQLEIASPLGLWALRRTAAVASEIRVYPNLTLELRDMAALFLNSRACGIHSQRRVGKGRDFEHLRNYVSGDSYEDISWKATARRNHPVTKVYQLEKTQQVYVIVDSSRLSCRQSPSLLKKGLSRDMAAASASTMLERFLTAALVTGLAAEQQGDLFGMLTYSDSVDRFVKASTGKNHFNTCRDALYTVEPRLVTPDFAELFSFMITRLRRRALLIFLTSLDDQALAESFMKNIHLLARKHVVIVNMIKPVMAGQMFTEQNVTGIDDLYRVLGGHLLWARLRETEKALRRQGVGFFMLESEALCTRLVSQYLSIKQRQLI